MHVSELMTRDVVTVPSDATVAEAVRRQLAAGVGSVIVVDEGEPAGLVTETDALEAAVETGDPLAEIRAGALCHPPVVTTQPDRSVRHVAREMAAEDVKKVPVLEGIDLVGIVTLTDIVWHLSELGRESWHEEANREEWSP